MTKKGSDMTSEQLSSLKDEMREWIAEGFKDIKERLSELFGKDIQHVNTELERHTKQHEEHYIFERDITKQVNNLEKNLEEKLTSTRESLRKEMQEELESHEEKELEKKSFEWGKVAVIIALVGTSAGIIIQFVLK